MLRRKKKNADGAPPDAGPPAAAGPDPQMGAGSGEPGDAAIAFADAPPEPEVAAAPPPPPPPPPAAPEPGPAPASSGRRGPMVTPPPPPVFGDQPLTTSFWTSSVASVLSKPAPEDRESQAAAEFQAAIMPGLLGLRDEVPEAASPEDAMAALRQREADRDHPVDEEGEALKGGDIFRTDASVYYRIRTRFEKPRRRVGWGEPWRPPPGLHKPDPPRRRALERGE